MYAWNKIVTFMLSLRQIVLIKANDSQKVEWGSLRLHSIKELKNYAELALSLQYEEIVLSQNRDKSRKD